MEQIGRYQIVRELGRGAMGVVYHAVDPTIGRPLAIKTIRLREVDDPAQRDKLRERLFREARSAGVLSHANIVTIYDMEEDDGVAYIAMEFVDGPTLDHVLNRPEALAPERMFSVLQQTAIALDYAHQKGIIHRDIKPANIMLDRGGSAKITDFGIAKINSTEGYTMTGTIVGTPNYMSPEQVQGVPVDGRSDQFSLAVVAYEILTGERPFPGEHLSTVVYKIVAEEPVPSHRINPSLGPHIDAVLRKALAKKPEARYVNCLAFIRALEAACARTTGWTNLARGSSPSLPTMMESRAELPLPEASVVPELTAKKQQRGFLAIAVALIIAVGILSAIAHFTTSGSHPEQFKPVATVAQPMPESPDKHATVTSSELPAAANAQIIADPGPPAPAPTNPVSLKPAPSNVPARLEPREPPKPLDIWITTNPPGATAALDDHNDASCLTPCLLQGMPGVHNLAISMVQYQPERREIRVGTGPQDVPLITLRPVLGTLIITTPQPGASVSINGDARTETTPAQISLPPGSYHVAVERNGKQASMQVEVRNGNTNVLKFPLH